MGLLMREWYEPRFQSPLMNANMNQDMAMPGDNFGDNNFLWGQALLNAVSSYVPSPRFRSSVLIHQQVDL